jgi:Flp pilus assembly protein CpaB
VTARPAIDRRTILGAVLAVAAGLMVLLITRPASTSGVLVAGADLAAGVPLGTQTVTVRSTPTPEGLVAVEDPGAFADWVLTAPLDAGEPIPASLLIPEPRRTRPDVVAVALDEEHAVLGVLRPGDLVDVYLTAPDPEGEPSTDLVADRVFVVDVLEGPSGLGAGDSARLLLAADRHLAAVLVHALRTGDVDLVRVGR